MAMKTKLIVDAETGESEMVALTPEELEQQSKDEAEYAKRNAETAKAAANKEAAKAKLEALGLTLDDLTALGL
jgi:hypothetical protein